MIKISHKDKWIQRAKNVHSTTYDYSKVKYLNSKTKVEIICSIHGNFWQRPSHHTDGHGCFECGRLKTIASRKLTNELIDEKLINSNRNIKRIGDITFAKEHTKWQCLNEFCKMMWDASPDSVINSENGCPHCHFRKNTELNGKLYLVEFINRNTQDSFLKIGITKDSIKRRFHSYIKDYLIKELFVMNLSISAAYKIEQSVILDMKSHQKIPEKSFRGRTECFVNSPKIKNILLEKIDYYCECEDGNRIECTSSNPSSNVSTTKGHASNIIGW